MKHIRGKFGHPVCGAKVTLRKMRGGSGTDVAMEADCSACRGKLLVGPPGQKGCDVVEPKKWKAQPYSNAKDMLAQKKKNVDGK